MLPAPTDRRENVMLEIRFGCENGHSWQVATGADLPPDQDTVSIPLTGLHPVCTGCGLAASSIRIRLRGA